jgi:type VI secretion system secreted protein VgrG
MNIASEAGMNVHIKGGINVVVEAGVSLTLKVGGNFVNISPAGVAIQGTMVMINSGGAAGSGSGSSPTAAAAAEAPTAPEAPNDAIESEPGSVAAAKAASPEQLKRATTSSTAVREFSDPQAQVLAAAAESGTPFCEECERARQQQGGGA